VGTLYQVHIQESVLPPLTKDKKRIHDEEIVASVAWRSVLYVTNFREEMDDAQIRGVLSRFTKFVSGWFRFQFGTIVDVRWPSKRIKSTRRFCYIQYTSPVGFFVKKLTEAC